MLLTISGEPDNSPSFDLTDFTSSLFLFSLHTNCIYWVSQSGPRPPASESSGLMVTNGVLGPHRRPAEAVPTGGLQSLHCERRSRDLIKNCVHCSFGLSWPSVIFLTSKTPTFSSASLRCSFYSPQIFIIHSFPHWGYIEQEMRKYIKCKGNFRWYPWGVPEGDSVLKALLECLWDDDNIDLMHFSLN